MTKKMFASILFSFIAVLALTVTGMAQDAPVEAQDAETAVVTEGEGIEIADAGCGCTPCGPAIGCGQINICPPMTATCPTICPNVCPPMRSVCRPAPRCGFVRPFCHVRVRGHHGCYRQHGFHGHHGCGQHVIQGHHGFHGQHVIQGHHGFHGQHVIQGNHMIQGHSGQVFGSQIAAPYNNCPGGNCYSMPAGRGRFSF